MGVSMPHHLLHNNRRVRWFVFSVLENFLFVKVYSLFSDIKNFIEKSGAVKRKTE